MVSPILLLAWIELVGKVSEGVLQTLFRDSRLELLLLYRRQILVLTEELAIYAFGGGARIDTDIGFGGNLRERRFLEVPEDPLSEIVPTGESAAFADFYDGLAILVELVLEASVLRLQVCDALVDLGEGSFVYHNYE